MNFLLTLIIFSIPLIVSAGGFGPLGFPTISFMVFIIFAVLLFPMFLLYLLGNKSHLLLLLIDIIFSLIYALIISFLPPVYYLPGILLLYDIIALLILIVIFGIILFIQKIRGKDISSLSKVLIHGSLIGIITILFVVAFLFGGIRILYSTHCDINLILNSEIRKDQTYMCVLGTAINQGNPLLCNKAGNSKEINDCKFRASIALVESGNLSGCNYLKSNENKASLEVKIYYTQRILDKCEAR